MSNIFFKNCRYYNTTLVDVLLHKHQSLNPAKRQGFLLCKINEKYLSKILVKNKIIRTFTSLNNSLNIPV